MIIHAFAFCFTLQISHQKSLKERGQRLVEALKNVRGDKRGKDFRFINKFIQFID